MIIKTCGINFEVEDSKADLFFGEEDVLEKHWLVDRDQVCLDVGCGPGTWSLIALARGAYTFSFDPKPLAVKILMDHIILNKFDRGAIIPVGLWRHPGTLPFSDASFVMGFERGSMDKEYRVMTLDDFANTLDRIDRICIDAEASELEILRGGRLALRKFRPMLVIEVHNGVSENEITQEILKASPNYMFKFDKTNTPGARNGFIIAEVQR